VIKTNEEATTAIEDILIFEKKADAFEITQAMIEAGEEAILCQVGGADLGGFFSARDLAISVFRAMGGFDLLARRPPLAHNPREQ
jgi:hypothetical protein